MKLGIGTAQFGSEYGVSNTSGKLCYSEAKKILSFAKNNGICYIDTASGYGDAEIFLGTSNVSSQFVISKISDEIEAQSDIVSSVKLRIEESMRKLNITKIYAVLLHRSDYLLGQRGEKILSVLQGLKSEGRLQKFGVSVYDPSELDNLQHLNLDIVQLPMNILDRRFENTGWLKKLKDQGTEIHARSLFLQGLLLMDVNSLPPYFLKWLPELQLIEDIVEYTGTTKIAACLQILSQSKYIDVGIVGVQNVLQLKEVVNATKYISDTILEIPECNDDELINPRNWKICP